MTVPSERCPCPSSVFCLGIMLTSALRILVKNPVKESIYEKRKKKKLINILTIFFISHKSDVKIFFN